MQANINYLFSSENGIRFNPSPPHPNSVAKPLDYTAAKDWIAAHPTKYQEALRELVRNVEFIRAEQFQKQLNRTTENFKRQLVERDVKNYTILVEPKKSNQWVAELAYAHLPQPFNLSRLGIKDAESFRSELDKQSGPTKNKEVVPKNIVLFDDGSYSGTQITDHVSAIFRELKNNYKIENAKMPHIYVVIPYISKFALAKLKTSVEDLHLSDHLHVADHIEMKTVEDLSIDAKDKIKELYWSKEENGNQQHGLFYFAHKVPNDMSFPGSLAKGTVHNGTDRTAAPVTYKFPIIPSTIQPPYKNESSSLA